MAFFEYGLSDMGNILIVGCASVDTLHLESNGRRKTFMTVGGAGLYTALAAAGAGANVTIFAPRPEPMQDRFLILEKATRWIGPVAKPAQMPELEIVHHGGGKATLLQAAWGAERLLHPKELNDSIDQALPFDIVHIAALSSASRQLEFCQYFKTKKILYKRISVGTYAKAVIDDKDSVKRMARMADFFFLNENEANLLYGLQPIELKEGQSVFVTRGCEGARLHENSKVTELSALKASELDPTGAGDTFCGATIAGLSNDLDCKTAAKLAMNFAARVIERPGPSHWLDEQSRHDL